jgi:hypothetical protein
LPALGSLLLLSEYSCTFSAGIKRTFVFKGVLSGLLRLLHIVLSHDMLI